MQATQIMWALHLDKWRIFSVNYLKTIFCIPTNCSERVEMDQMLFTKTSRVDIL